MYIHAEVGNSFLLRAILGLYMFLAGQIQVKYIDSKLKTRVCGPNVIRGMHIVPFWFTLLLNLGNRNKMIILGSLLTTYGMIQVF